MDTDSLITLRDNILSDVMPLVIETSEAGAGQFDLLLRVIQTGNAPKEVYTRAYASAQAIQDKDDKLNALMLLLDEVELDLNKNDSAAEPTEDAVPIEPQAPSAQEPSGPEQGSDNQYQ